MRMTLSGLLLLAVLPACNVLLPAHSHSDDRKGETVRVTAITFDEMEARFGNHYEKVIGIRPGMAGDTKLLNGDEVRSLEPADFDDVRKIRSIARTGQEVKPLGVAPIAAAAATFVVGAAVDYAAKQLEKEKDRYEGQYSVREAFDRFWLFKRMDIDGGKQQVRVQHYAGFELVRKTNNSEPASRFVFAILPSHDGLFFRLQPIYLKIDAAKAKVLSYQGKDWYTTLWTWALKTGSKVNATFKVTVEAIWRDKKRKVQSGEIASELVVVKSYDLDDRKVYDEEFVASGKGWFGALPVSEDENGDPVGSGTFWLSVTATEKDPSNAAEYLDKAATELSSNKDKIVEAVKEYLEGQK